MSMSMSSINGIENKNAREFAEACYDCNSVGELQSALSITADATDCATWGITAEQWLDAVKAALNEKLADATDCANEKLADA